VRRVSTFFPRHRRGELVAVCRRNPKTSLCRFCTMLYRSWRNVAERMYTRLRSRHLVQAFASKHLLRRDVSTAMIYTPKDRSTRSLAFASKRRQKTSCLNICKTVESTMLAYHGVVGGCSRGESRSGGGFTSHSGRFIVAAGRESDYGASPQATSRVGQTATRGASPKSTAHNAQHQWLTESHKCFEENVSVGIWKNFFSAAGPSHPAASLF
jgi:hypothetical protein